MIYEQLKKIPDLKYTYRFVFIPETIGSICLLSQKGKHLKKYLKAGFVITCIGDDGPFTYKKSRIGNALPDRIVELLLEQTETTCHIVDFSLTEAVTNGNTVRPGSICLSARLCAQCTVNILNIILPATIKTSYPLRLWKLPSINILT
jgi:hypothetical protein